MATDIPPFNPDPRPGSVPEPEVPPFGPGTIPDVPDDDVPIDPDDPGDEPFLPPEREPFPEEPVPPV